MSQVATRRLIDASAALAPADRALLNILVNRGLDDAVVARMTGMSEEAVAGRRSRMVTQLSAELGLPPESVRSALNEITAAPDGDASETSAVEAARPELAASPEAAASPEVAARAGPGARPRWRRRGLALVVIAIATAAVLAVLLASSGPGHDRRAPAAAPAPARPATAAGRRSVATPTAPRTEPLVALPGSPNHPTGTVTIARRGQNLALNVSLADRLAQRGHGHYEVWLYDSITNSRAIGPLGTRAGHQSLRLPSDAGRYPWIDISFQPTGVVSHSGESLLRAANPAFAPADRRP